jgi:hypothetical protein
MRSSTSLARRSRPVEDLRQFAGKAQRRLLSEKFYSSVCSALSKRGLSTRHSRASGNLDSRLRGNDGQERFELVFEFLRHYTV